MCADADTKFCCAHICAVQVTNSKKNLANNPSEWEKCNLIYAQHNTTQHIDVEMATQTKANFTASVYNTLMKL